MTLYNGISLTKIFLHEFQRLMNSHDNIFASLSVCSTKDQQQVPDCSDAPVTSRHHPVARHSSPHNHDPSLDPQQEGQ